MIRNVFYSFRYYVLCVLIFLDFAFYNLWQFSHQKNVAYTALTIELFLCNQMKLKKLLNLFLETMYCTQQRFTIYIQINKLCDIP